MLGLLLVKKIKKKVAIFFQKGIISQNSWEINSIKIALSRERGEKLEVMFGITSLSETLLFQ